MKIFEIAVNFYSKFNNLLNINGVKIVAIKICEYVANVQTQTMYTFFSLCRSEVQASAGSTSLHTP